ncbi:MAG: lipopolysaccharide heptosyltransferase II [Candidatus Binatia bacterium]
MRSAAPRHSREQPPPAPARVLVKEVNWLGDLVMSLPALRAIRRAFPAAHLAVLVKQELASFFDGAYWLDEVLTYRVGRSLRGIADRARVVAAIRAGRFDLAIVFPRSFESAFWTALGGVPRRVGYEADGRGLLLTDRVRRSAALLRGHQAHDYLHLLSTTLGIAGEPSDCRIDVADRHRATMGAWLTAHRRSRGPLVALAVAAAYGPAKEWPAARWTALIDRLAERYGAECVLVGAPGERQRSADIAAPSRHGALVAAGETGVGEAIALLARCDAFVGNDSGSMHVAGALGIPTVGVFGSTNPERTAPLGARTRIAYRQVACSPCLERTCRFGHYECLHAIEVDEIERALVELGALS